MAHLFQCVPNVSEGRNLEAIEAIATALRAIAGIKLLDYSADKDHNRSVFTLVGEADPLQNAIMAMFAVADKYIDLRNHRGAHPRVGAVDVVPFVPLEDTPMEEAVALSKRVAATVAAKYQVPIYYYEESAVNNANRSLAYLRRGGFEALLQLDDLTTRPADVGPQCVHPRLGACCMGARRPLVAFNVLLDTADVTIAQAIAKRIRYRDGGLRYVRALGIFLAEVGLAQVSINLLDTESTALHTVFEMVKSEARMYGVTVRSSELIGVMPLATLTDTAAYYLQLPGFTPQRVLERGVLDCCKAVQPTCARERQFQDILDDLASARPDWGGGSAVLLGAAMGACLVAMAARVSAAGCLQGTFTPPEMSADDLERHASNAQHVAYELTEWAARDGALYGDVVAAQRLPKDDPARPDAILAALKEAIVGPLQAAELIKMVLDSAEALKPNCKKANISDIVSGVNMLQQGIRGVLLNVRWNCGTRECFAEYLKQAEMLEHDLIRNS